MTRAADIFCDHFSLRTDLRERELLAQVAGAFAQLPYENLTKLLRKHRVASGPQRRRQPEEVMREHLEIGAGGTCFALTRLFEAVLARLGCDSHPVLCDTRHRPDNHCALIVLADGRPHLVDPGYLIHEPLALPEGGDKTVRGDVELRPVQGEQRAFDLYSYGIWRHRLKARPVGEARFTRVWDASFDGSMMNGVHVSAARPEGGYAYVHGHKLRLQGRDSKETRNIRGDERQALAQRFGLSPELVTQAYDLVALAKRER